MILCSFCFMPHFFFEYFFQNIYTKSHFFQLSQGVLTFFCVLLIDWETYRRFVDQL